MAIYAFIWSKHITKINVYFPTVHILRNFLIPADPFLVLITSYNEIMFFSLFLI